MARHLPHQLQDQEQTGGPGAMPGTEPAETGVGGGTPQPDPQREGADMPGVPVTPGEANPEGEPTTAPTPPGQAAYHVSPGAGDASAPGVPAKPRQTLAGRVWVAIACAVVLLVLLIIFIAENSRRVTISFLGAHGHISEALALLAAIVVGIAITLLVGSARIIQLSLEVRRSRRQLQRLG